MPPTWCSPAIPLTPHAEPTVQGTDGNRSITIGTENHGSVRREGIENLLPRMPIVVLPHTDQRHSRRHFFIQPRFLVGASVVGNFHQIVGPANGTSGQQRLLGRAREITKEERSRNIATTHLPHDARVVARCRRSPRPQYFPVRRTQGSACPFRHGLQLRTPGVEFIEPVLRHGVWNRPVQHRIDLPNDGIGATDVVEIEVGEHKNVDV